MTQKRRVTSAVATHFPNGDKVAVEDSEYRLQNHQKGQMLMDPDEVPGVSTHSSGDLRYKGPRKAPTTAALHDLEVPKGGRIAEIDNEVDPSDGYLEKEAGMPVINNASAEEDADDDEFNVDEEVHAEFEDMPDIESDAGADDMDEEFDIPEPVAAEADEDADAEFEEETDPVPEAFEEESAPGETVALVDLDGVEDDGVENEVAFATMASVVHVIHQNRIVASMGAASAKRAGMSDIYQSEQFQDVVAHAIETKGLRKGLVQSGFVLAKVRVAANKVQEKAIKAKVQAALNHKVELMAAADKRMDQCLAIAAVGINRRFFKDTPNELRAGLEAEFTRAGVRGAATIIRAMFAEHGPGYAKSIMTLAKKISAMPEQVCDQYADALDLTEEKDFDDDTDTDVEVADADTDFDQEDSFEEIPTSVTAALSYSQSPRSVGALLKAGVRSTTAMSILSGSQSLI